MQPDAGGGRHLLMGKRRVEGAGYLAELRVLYDVGSDGKASKTPLPSQGSCDA